ncbi:MAG: SGNH/GDSL hydrolase family protein [Candidatus Paceibacterota bacterium]
MKIGVWGDSITYGAGDSEALGWVGRLRRELEKASQVGVYNFGICGDSTEDILKRFAIERDAVRPEVVIFAVGTNDAKYPEGGSETYVPLETYKQNIRSLVEQAKSRADKVCIVGLTKADEAHMRKSGTVFLNATTGEYNDYLRALASEEQVSFIDVFEVIDTAIDLADGLHPNAQGYEKLFQAIKPFFA